MQVPILSSAETDLYKIVAAIRWVLGRFATGRETLTEARTYHVDDTGSSDANDGRSASTAFATIQKAVNTVAALDRSTFAVTISVAAGTYNESVTLKDSPGSEPINLTGSGIATCTINNPTGGAACITKSGGATPWIVSGFKFTRTTAGNGVVALNGAQITLNTPFEFGAFTGAFQIVMQFGGKVFLAPPYTISGGAAIHIFGALTGGGGLSGGGLITISGSPTFADAWVVGDGSGVSINLAGATFSPTTGAFTGSRFRVTNNAHINAIGGDNFIPGSAAGTRTNGGIYG